MTVLFATQRSRRVLRRRLYGRLFLVMRLVFHLKENHFLSPDRLVIRDLCLYLQT